MRLISAGRRCAIEDETQGRAARTASANRQRNGGAPAIGGQFVGQDDLAAFVTCECRARQRQPVGQATKTQWMRADGWSLGHFLPFLADGLYRIGNIALYG